MAFSPGDKQHGESGQDTSTSPLVVSNRFAALDTSDSGLGPQAIAPQVPEQVLVPATVPSQTHRQLPCTTQTVHRGTVNVGTWNVRGLKVQKHVHKPVDVSFLLAKTSLSALSRSGWTPIDTVMTPGFSYVGTAGYATEVGPRGGTGFLIKQDVMRYAAALERAKV
jgi:hypothetical protein